jgi:hypothetical protein
MVVNDVFKIGDKRTQLDSNTARFSSIPSARAWFIFSTKMIAALTATPQHNHADVNAHGGRRVRHIQQGECFR